MRRYTQHRLRHKSGGSCRFFHSINQIPSQKLNEQIIQEVRSCTDEDMVGRNTHAPKRTQMLCNGLPQTGMTLIGQRAQQFLTQIQHHAALQP